MADRENDLYDQFARRPERVDLLCRAAQDRALLAGSRLFAACAAWPEQDRYEVEVPVRGPRPARRASVAVRFGEVTLRRPATADRCLAETVTLRVVDVAVYRAVQFQATGRSKTRPIRRRSASAADLPNARITTRRRPTRSA